MQLEGGLYLCITVTDFVNWDPRSIISKEFRRRCGKWKNRLHHILICRLNYRRWRRRIGRNFRGHRIAGSGMRINAMLQLLGSWERLITVFVYMVSRVCFGVARRGMRLSEMTNRCACALEITRGSWKFTWGIWKRSVKRSISSDVIFHGNLASWNKFRIMV